MNTAGTAPTTSASTTSIDGLCELLYPGGGPEVAQALRGLMGGVAGVPARGGRFRPGAGDAVLIAYGDQIRHAGEHPLATLADVAHRRFPFLPVVHLLPFFPYSSDDGFSVIDYLSVDPALGDWADIATLAADKRLMFDAVVNHISARSPWFADYLAGRAPHADLALAVQPDADLSQVVRPRTSPLLTPFEAHDGVRYVWTTFSADQVDLNYGSPATLLSVVEVLLEYVRRGAAFLRLDAIAFAWKEVGSASIHHPNTHRLVKLMRAVLDEVAPSVTLITETNVPHAENVAYFGDGHDEAQLVYNFALPPLVLHTFVAEDATALSRWAADLTTAGGDTWFLNFLASHDGIGVRGVESILTPTEIDALARRTLDHDGLVGARTMPDGSQRAYELNINYFDALSDPSGDEPLPRQIARFLCAHSIAVCLPGVPAVYAHSLVGSRGDRRAVDLTGVNRSINRAKLDRARLESELDDPASLRHAVFEGLRGMLETRARLPELDPAVGHRVEHHGRDVFALRRGPLLCVHNVTGRDVTLAIAGVDELTGQPLPGHLGPYSYAWVRTTES